MTRVCPDCERDVLAVVDVQSLGTETFDVVEGDVCPVRGDDCWRLFVHEEVDST